MHQDPYRRERTYGYVGLATARRFFLCVFSLSSCERLNISDTKEVFSSKIHLHFLRDKNRPESYVEQVTPAMTKE